MNQLSGDEGCSDHNLIIMFDMWFNGMYRERSHCNFKPTLLPVTLAEYYVVQWHAQGTRLVQVSIS